MKKPLASQTGLLWKQVSSLLAQRIRDGIYPIGSALPREVDLASELGVSRNTVRAALRILSDQGMVDRRKRLGTVVLSDSAEGKIRFNIDPLASLARLHGATHLRVIDKCWTRLPRSIREAYPTAYADEWLLLTLTRTSELDGRALSSVQVYLHPRFEKVEPLVDREHNSIFKLIEKMTGERLDQVQTTVSPRRVSAEIAQRLGVSRGELALLVSHRIFNDAGELVEVAEGTYPSSRYQMELAFSIRGSAA